MRHMIVIAAGLALLGSPVQAQDEPLLEVVVVEPAQDDGRLALAREFARVTTTGMDKIVSQSLQASVGDTENTMDAEESRWFVTNGEAILSRHMPVLIDAMAVDYSQRFTTAELQAMIDFYETPMGQDIARKQMEAGAAIGPAIVQFQTAFLTDLLEKYCASFDCASETASATKNRR